MAGLPTSLHAVLPFGAYDRARVAGKSRSTAAGPSNSATTRMTIGGPVSLSAPSSVAKSHRAQVGLDGAAPALHNGLLDLQVGGGLRLDRELVGEAVALGPPSLVIRGAEQRAAELACRAPERQLLQEDETNRCATTCVRFGLKMTLLRHREPSVCCNGGGDTVQRSDIVHP
jgi:hypothetical protein